MQMDAGMDTGPMLAARAVAIGPDETAIELSVRLSRVGAELLSETLPLFERDQIQPIAQDNNQASYAPLLKREHGLIDWSMPAKRISDQVRGFQPWPGSYTVFRGGRLIVWQARPVIVDSMPSASLTPGRTGVFGLEPGMIASLDKTGIVVSCAENSLMRIDEVQLEGKKRVSARDFANGARLGIGSLIRDETLTS
jgi:methionyl-tRNA formyltransferase